MPPRLQQQKPIHESTLEMPVIAISGAGSGIGHEFLNFYVREGGHTIHATESWNEDMSDNNPSSAHIIKHTVDTSSPSPLDDLTASLNGTAIDLFIYSAAVRGLVPSVTEESDIPGAAETLEVTDRDTVITALQVNVLGSFLLIRALLAGLKKASEGSSNDSPAKCIVMGSRMGSIGNNDDGGSYAYRASKAGLNALVKAFSINVPEVIFTVIHPGRVKSQMTYVREDGAVDSGEAIEMMKPLIEGLGKKNTGKFYVREGDKIPW